MEYIYREFTLPRMTDKASGNFLRSLADCRGHITDSFSLGANLADYRYVSMFFKLKFYRQQDVDKFHSLGFVTTDPPKIYLKPCNATLE